MMSTRAYNWYVSLVAASCMVLYGFDASVFNAVQNSQNWLRYFGFDPKRPEPNTLASVNTAYTVGAIVGGFFFGGPCADYLGRKAGMWIGALFTVVATLMQTFSPYNSLGCFIAGRAIIGVAQGIALTSGPIYIGEMAPPEIRGTIMTFWQLFYSVGSFIAFWVAYGTSNHVQALGEWDWKMVVIFQMLVPVIILVLVPFIPGTPRWFIKKGKIDKARAALTKIRATPQEVEDEILMIREAIEYEKEAISSGYGALWKDRSVRKRLLLAFVLNAGQQITGQGTLNTYSSTIYKTVFQSSTTISLVNALNATLAIFFTLNAAWIADRYGRKPLFIIGALGMSVSMLCVAIVGSATPTADNGGKSYPVGVALTFLFFLFAFFYKPSWGATTWIWTSEIFSMNVRAQAVGMASQVQNVANSIFQQFFPTFLARCKFYTFFFFFGINLLLAVFVYFFIPETKGILLEEMDTLFGGSNHVEKGADLMHVENAHHAASVSGADSHRVENNEMLSKTGASVVHAESKDLEAGDGINRI